MKKLIAMLMTALMMLFIAASALPLSVGIGTGICAATDVGGGAEDVKAPQFAPLNPDFVAYWENLPDEFYGDVPPPMDLSHLDQLPVKRSQISDALRGSFDWRDYGKVTPVKNQNPCGTCWAFAATSALESAVLIGESATYDFSEQSVALCVDRSWVYLYDDWDDPCGLIPGHAGGDCWLASEVFIRKGSVLESCNPYDGSALQCDGSCVCDSCPAIKKVDGFRVAAWDGSQIDTIKQAIYNNGPAKMSYYHSSSYEYWDPTWGAIYDYYPCSGGTNHAVTVVGWDDDVPHLNPSHGGTGAWIIKNSWGTSDSWAGGAGVSDGYFYLAYHSSCVKRVIHLEYKDPVSGEELLYWDEAGQVGAGGFGDNDAWMASVFTADQASDLTHVDFWTTSNNAQYEIYVWDGFFGTQLAHQTGTCQEDGYYSIPLSSPISINAGQQFTVGVDMTTPGYNYPIPAEYEITGRVDPPIQTGVSFIRHTGSNPWTDFAVYDRNACLRARMVPPVENTITNIELSPPSPASLKFFEHVDITFDYSTNEAGGAFIFVHPYTEGSLTPYYVTNGSPLYPVGSGSGSGWFTIYTSVTVDQLRFQMLNADQSELLLEFFIDVEYHFGEKPNSITNIELSPPSPASLKFNEHVDITFDYSTNEAGGVRISVRPYTGGSLTPNYAASGSPLYPVGSGSGSGWFTITSGAVTVDQLRFRMWNADKSELLLEFFVDVEYHFGEKPTISISTDKTSYSPGDTMTTTISFKNPASSSVDTVFAWYLHLPAYNYWQQIYVSALTLPANYDESVKIPIKVGDWGKTGFNAEWHVWLVEPKPPHAIISHDATKWSYIPGKKAQGETMPADIAKEITKEIEGVELPGKKAQGETVPVEIVEELTKEKKK